jgi:hypothetical protein
MRSVRTAEVYIGNSFGSKLVIIILFFFEGKFDRHDSTISHVGFILLALSISSVESTQAFIFYLIQYSISNLNAFIILISIGFSLFSYSSDNKEYKDLLDKNNSPERGREALTRHRKPSSYWV